MLFRSRTKNRFTYSPALRIVRYALLLLFIIALLAGVGSFVALLAPYSSYGRIVSTLFAPFYQWGNNVLAFFDERAGNYLFYETDVWIKSIPVFIIALITLTVITVLAWKNGRTYCNVVCPVGTFLGLIARYSLLKPRFDADKCNSCGLCARNCKASCIDSKNHQIDYTRCVTCFDCIEKCRKGAIRYVPARSSKKREEAPTSANEPIESSRRSMLSASALLLTTAAVKAQTMKMDGGLAYIEDKKIPKRQTPIVPPGARSLRHFAQHCTACQLCVSV